MNKMVTLLGKYDLIDHESYDKAHQIIEEVSPDVIFSGLTPELGKKTLSIFSLEEPLDFSKIPESWHEKASDLIKKLPGTVSAYQDLLPGDSAAIRYAITEKVPIKFIGNPGRARELSRIVYEGNSLDFEKYNFEYLKDQLSSNTHSNPLIVLSAEELEINNPHTLSYKLHSEGFEVHRKIVEVLA